VAGQGFALLAVNQKFDLGMPGTLAVSVSMSEASVNSSSRIPEGCPSANAAVVSTIHGIVVDEI